MHDHSHVKIMVIVPAYNEGENIEAVIGKLQSTPGIDFVVINDGSSDNTEEILTNLAAPHVALCQNLGIGGAMQTGYKYAWRNGYDIAVQFDGDGQHDERFIEKIVAPIVAGEADLVVGSRFLGGENTFKSSALRRTGICCLSGVLKIATGTRVLDVTSGFRAVGREAMEIFARKYPTDYPEPESLASVLSAGLRVKEIPVVMHERMGGVSSIGGLSAVYYMIKVSIAILLSASRGRR